MFVHVAELVGRMIFGSAISEYLAERMMYSIIALCQVPMNRIS